MEDELDAKEEGPWYRGVQEGHGNLGCAAQVGIWTEGETEEKEKGEQIRG